MWNELLYTVFDTNTLDGFPDLCFIKFFMPLVYMGL